MLEKGPGVIRAVKRATYLKVETGRHLVSIRGNALLKYCQISNKRVESFGGVRAALSPHYRARWTELVAD